MKLSRSDSLASEALIPPSEREAAQLVWRQAGSDVKATQADVEAARALVREAQLNLNYTVIRSPIDGVIVNRSVDVGQTVTARVESPVLLTIADLRRMNLLAEVSEADVASVSPGTPVTFQVESLGTETLEGVVSQLRLQPMVQRDSTTALMPISPSTSTNQAAGTATAGNTSTMASPTTNTPSSVGATATAGSGTPGRRRGNDRKHLARFHRQPIEVDDFG